MQDVIFGVIGGLALFIYGIKLMGDGLQKFAAQKMRQILSALTNNRVMGVLVGAGVTSIVQSSSATTVMTVGFVNAGLMTLTQSLGIILGANIGTTVTGQLIAFKFTKYAMPILAFGGIFYLFGRKKKIQHFGQSIFGFGMLFVGLNMMTSVVKGFSNNEFISHLFVSFSHNPILAVLVGMLVTFIFQSSSVTVGLTITLASVGMIDVSAALPLVLGENIGTCITALLAGIGTTISAKRTAIAHMFFNLVGVIIALTILPFMLKLVTFTSNDIARQVANGHTIFNICMTLLFLPFLGYFARFIKFIVPGEDITVERGPKYLEKHLLNTPSIAINAATKEIVRMAELAREMITHAYIAFVKKDRQELAKVAPKEEVVDELQDAITNYLVQLTRKELGEAESNLIPALLHSVNDVERIGDHAENIVELAERRMDNKLVFSRYAYKELEKMYTEIDLMLSNTIKALTTRDVSLAKQALEQEEKINKWTDEFREHHIQRLKHGKCEVVSGVVFLDMIMNLEKIGDHLTNINEAICEKFS